MLTDMLLLNWRIKAHGPSAGAVAARLRVYDMGIAIVNAHMSSGEGEADRLKRHSEYSDSLRRMVFAADTEAPDSLISLDEAPSAAVDGVRTLCTPRSR